MDHARIKDVLNNNDTIVVVEQSAPRVKRYHDKNTILINCGTQTLPGDKENKSV